jgi:hypothetical protein
MWFLTNCCYVIQLQSDQERAIIPERFMRSLDRAVEEAEDEIVSALEKQLVGAHAQQPRPEPSEPVKRPIPTENCDLEAAIDDMLTRFPKTLEYLAK